MASTSGGAGKFKLNERTIVLLNNARKLEIGLPTSSFVTLDSFEKLSPRAKYDRCKSAEKYFAHLHSGLDYAGYEDNLLVKLLSKSTAEYLRTGLDGLDSNGSRGGYSSTDSSSTSAALERKRRSRQQHAAASARDNANNVSRELRVIVDRVLSAHAFLSQHSQAVTDGATNAVRVGRPVRANQVLQAATTAADAASGNSSLYHYFETEASEEVREEHEARQVYQVLNEVLPEKIGTVQLTPQVIAMLVRQFSAADDDDSEDARHSGKNLSFTRIVQHVAASRHWTQDDLTMLLRHLHECKPQINYKTLPKTGKGLMATTRRNTEGTTFWERRRRPLAYGENGDDIRLIEAGPPHAVASKKKVVGEYMHFGIRDALLVKSPGLVEKWKYLSTMRLIYALFPELIPLEIYDAIGPKAGEEYDKKMLLHWDSLPKPSEEIREGSDERDLVLQIHGHIDGVQWFRNSIVSKATPILGRLVGIKDRASGKSIKIPTLDPFVIGVMQSKNKVDTKEFVKDFVEELVHLSDPSRSKLSFTVEMTAMVCDAPQRSECKGITSFGGYYGCERCVTKGVCVCIPTGKMKSVMQPNGTFQEEELKRCGIRFPDLGCTPRTDSKWETYKKPMRHDVRITYVYIYLPSDDKSLQLYIQRAIK